MLTVEKLSRIMADLQGSAYGTLEAHIVIGVIYKEIGTVPITDQSMLSKTNYDFLISIESAIRLLRDKCSLNEQSILLLLEVE